MDTNESERTLSPKGADSQKGKYLPKGALCCSCIGTAGVIGIIGVQAQTNQQINTIVFQNENNREFLYIGIFHMQKRKWGISYLI